MESFFSKQVYEKIEEFIKESKNILLLSHLDADGLSSAGLLTQLLIKYDKEFTVRILKQLENKKELEQNHSDLIIISDMGSGQFNLIKEIINKKKVIIIDHHQPQNEFKHKNLIHFNPNINDENYSGSGLSYLITKTLKPELGNQLFIGLIGAFGDMQFKNGEFKGFNKEIIDLGILLGIINKKKGLNIYGRTSKPLYQALAYNYEIEIPGITENETNAINFLKELNIDLKNEDGTWKKLIDLTNDEKKRLITQIIIRRTNNKLDTNILGDIYELNNYPKKLSDLKEWSVLLNACGRQGAYSLGVLLCAGYVNYSLPLIEEVINNYKKLIVQTINRIKTDPTLFELQDELLIINGGEHVKDTIIGTIGGMMLKDKTYNVKKGLGFANRENNEVKKSTRTKNELINLGEILTKVCEKVGGTGGGHKNAGGALIKKENIKEFKKLFKEEIISTKPINI